MNAKTPKSWERDLEPCPDLPSGDRCPECGAAYICRQTWRKESTPEKRLEARLIHAQKMGRKMTR